MRGAAPGPARDAISAREGRGCLSRFLSAERAGRIGLVAVLIGMELSSGEPRVGSSRALGAWAWRLMRDAAGPNARRSRDSNGARYLNT